MLVYLTQKVLSSTTLSRGIYCCTFLVINHFVCVLSTTADCNLFNNHRSKNWQEANTIFSYSMRMLVHPTQKVLSSTTLSRDIYCCTFLVKYHFVCVLSTTVDCNFFNKHRIKREVEGNYNDLVYYKNASAPHSEDVVPCNTFK